ncbi:MAG TPA: hypothetical protein VGE38_04410, partial [Nocardioides sp.]|uniref:hypothetical protein n=1 Tax=Nocardioides sp. TaxID=35761 RepID=UPI002ED8FED8
MTDPQDGLQPPRTEPARPVLVAVLLPFVVVYEAIRASFDLVARAWDRALTGLGGALRWLFRPLRGPLARLREVLDRLAWAAVRRIARVLARLGRRL